MKARSGKTIFWILTENNCEKWLKVIFNRKVVIMEWGLELWKEEFYKVQKWVNVIDDPTPYKFLKSC